MKWESWALALCAAGVVAGCLTPNRYLPRLPNDKLLHFTAHAVLTALLLRLTEGGAAVLALLALALAGWLLECLQQLVPDRGFSWRDLAANLAGMGAALGATLLLRAAF